MHAEGHLCLSPIAAAPCDTLHKKTFAIAIPLPLCTTPARSHHRIASPIDNIPVHTPFVDSPGPAQYSPTCTTTNTSPARAVQSRALRFQQKITTQVPGPGSYSPKRLDISSSKGFTRDERFRNSDSFESPGPKYQPKYVMQRAATPVFSTARRPFDVPDTAPRDQKSPGPSYYFVQTSHMEKTKRKWESIKFGRCKRELIFAVDEADVAPHDIPGPQYHVREEFATERPAFSFPKVSHSNSSACAKKQQDANTLGPGAYNPQNPIQQLEKRKGVSFGKGARTRLNFLHFEYKK